MSVRTILLVTAGGLLLVWALLSLLAPAETPPQADRPRLPPPERLHSPVLGPSGITCDATGGRRFVVGDRGDVAELDLQGRERSRHRVGGDLEDVAVLANGNLLILDETAAELFSYDYDRRREDKRWALDVDGLLGTARAPLLDDRFEGVAFEQSPQGSGRVLEEHSSG
jgi:hypothetical protein